MTVDVDLKNYWFSSQLEGWWRFSFEDWAFACLEMLFLQIIVLK